MNTFTVLAIYIAGVCLTYFQLQKWADHELTSKDEYQVVFTVSLLSWLVFPIYWAMSLYRKAKEE